MLISELIAKLEQIKVDEGDLEVHAWPYDGQGRMHCNENGEIDLTVVACDANLTVGGSWDGERYKTFGKKVVSIESE